MKSILKTFMTLILFVFAVVLFAPSSWAARVTKVKGKKVFIKLEGESAKKGQIFYVVNSKGQKKGLIKIKAIKGDRAFAHLGKGRVQKGNTLLPRNKKQSRIARKSKKLRGKKTSSSRMALGGFLGMSKNSMSVELNTTPTRQAEMDGYGMNYKAIFDYTLFKNVWFRGLLGIENFIVQESKASIDCDNKVCHANIQYLSADLWIRYIPFLDNWRPWLGVGLILWFPISQETDVLEKDSITNVNVMGVGGGLDWHVTSSFYIPFQAEYNLVAKSKQVNASAMTARLGLGLTF